jgi:hypothetical protein
MKKIAFALLPFLLIACAPKKGVAAFIDGKHTIESPCPEIGECKLELLRGTGLAIKTDHIGRLYYALEINPGKIVVRYTYTIKSKGYQDDGYSEELVFETDSQFSNIKTGNIKDTKILFGVQCFCRGKAGFYKVSEGTVTYADEKLHVKIPDSIIDDQRIYTLDVVLSK